MQSYYFYKEDLSEISVCLFYNARISVRHRNEKLHGKKKFNRKIILHTKYANPLQNSLSVNSTENTNFIKAKEVLESHVSNINIKHGSLSPCKCFLLVGWK